VRILQINKYHRVLGGADRVYFQTIDVLRRRGHEVIPFSSRAPGEEVVESPYSSFFVENLAQKLPLRLEDRSRIYLRGIYNLDACRSLEKLIRATKPQVAHVHNIHYQISPSIFDVLRRYDIPVVMTLHDYRLICPNGYLYTEGAVCERCKGGRFYNAVLHRCLYNSWAPSVLGATAAYAHAALRIYRAVDRYITHSRFVERKMIQFGLASEKLVYLPVPVKAAAFSSKVSAGEYFLQVGYVVPQKGPQVAIEAIQRTKGGRLVIVGEGPLVESLGRKVREGSIQRVSLAGFLSGSKLWDLFRGSLALVVPSLFHEPLGMVVLEAYALAKAVIASRVGGIPEIVEDGRTGLLVRPGDIEELASAMQALLDHPDRAEEMGRQARRLVVRRFSSEAYYDGLMSLYEDVAVLRQRRGGNTFGPS